VFTFVAFRAIINVCLAVCPSPTRFTFTSIAINCIGAISPVLAKMTVTVENINVTILPSIPRITFTSIIVHQIDTLSLDAFVVDTVVNVLFAKLSSVAWQTFASVAIDFIKTFSVVLAFVIHALVYVNSAIFSNPTSLTLTRITVHQIDTLSM